MQIDEVKTHPEFVLRRLKQAVSLLVVDTQMLDDSTTGEENKDTDATLSQDECMILLNAMNAAIATYAAAIKARQSAQLAEEAAELLAYITFMAWYEKCGQPQA